MATITSTQTGNWHTGSTWVGGSVPAANDLVVVSHGHRVTVSTNIQSAITDDVTIDGNLHFASGGKMHLNGRMTVANRSNNTTSAGEFVEGTTTSGSLLSMVGGSEIKISGDNSAQHGISIDDNRWCGVQLDGSEPTKNTQLNGAHSVGSYYITVDSAADFAAGDMISLYDYDVDWYFSVDECFYVHDVDASNNRLYVRQFTPPTAVIQSKSGSTITLDDASVFRVGYKLIFGTGSNRNTLEVTGISGNVVTFGSSVSGTVDGLTVYMGGTEKPHTDNRLVRRLANVITTNIAAAGTNQIVLNNAADFSTGDVLALEIWDENGINAYDSGSENNTWRHNILYTVTGKSSNTLTVDRTIPYKSDAYKAIVTKITRDVVIKACAANGDEVADGDQDTARVFFSVKYWTSTSYNNAPTRRIRIKNVYFKNLGYNTNDSTNFRAGVTIGGYNGRYGSTVNGSAHDNATVHTSNGYSQTGENYVSGCSCTAYSLVSNTVRDGDNYPSICIRHPYGQVVRNNICIGTGRGLWRWSSGYFTKIHGQISMVSNYSSMQIEAQYSSFNFLEYAYGRMAEDYGLMIHNTYQQQQSRMRHFDFQNQNYCFYISACGNNGKIDRGYFNRYNRTLVNERVNDFTFFNSHFMPNKWGGSNAYYTGTPGLRYEYEQFNGSSADDFARTDGEAGRVNWFDQGYRNGEMVETTRNMAKINKKGTAYNDFMLGSDNDKHYLLSVYVPANSTVKLRSTAMINALSYNGNTASVNSTSYPYLVAKVTSKNLNSAGQAQYVAGVSPSTTYSSTDNWNEGTTVRTSTQAQGDLLNGFFDKIYHTSACVGAFESKELTVAPQKESYMLNYGYFFGNNGAKEEGMQAKDIEVMMSQSHPGSDRVSKTNRKTRIGTSFTSNKKRISGRI
jgi:hypothetical protein